MEEASEPQDDVIASTGHISITTWLKGAVEGILEDVSHEFRHCKIP